MKDLKHENYWWTLWSSFEMIKRAFCLKRKKDSVSFEEQTEIVIQIKLGVRNPVVLSFTIHSGAHTGSQL